MPFLRFPSKFVYWTQIPDEVHQKIKKELVPKIEEKLHNEINTRTYSC